MTDFEAAFTAFARNQVDYIIVGGAAAIALGSARFTQDLDIVYQRSDLNLSRIVNALDEYIDLLGEIAGEGKYEDLFPEAVTLEVFGLTCRCLNIHQLIRAKRAAGRPKDLDALAELLEIQKAGEGDGNKTEPNAQL